MTEGIELLSVDLQNDFTTVGGICFENRPSVGFVKEILVPYIRESGLLINEILSDYRQPRKGDPRYCCKPGDWGFESILPRDIVKDETWIKSMNDPTWVRLGGGDPEREPGEPYQDPAAFDRWIDRNIGSLEDTDMIIVFGLTADRCVLCTAQQLAFRGYDVRVLKEATDVRSGDPVEKETFLMNTPFQYWAEPINFDEMRSLL